MTSAQEFCPAGAQSAPGLTAELDVFSRVRESLGGSISMREMRAELQRQVGAAGGVMSWCRKRGLTHPPVSLMLSGARPVSEAVGNACGFIVETTFKRVA